MFKKFQRNLSSLYEIVTYCVSISWKSSKLYTIVRLICKAIIPITTIALSYIAKEIIDLLAGNTKVSDKIEYLLFLLGTSLLIILIKKIVNKTEIYMMRMHNDLVLNHIKLSMMDTALNADIEYFDSPEYHDKFESIRRDTDSISRALWSILDGVGSIVTLISTFIIISRANFLFGLIIIAAVIPSVIIDKKYTKTIYNWGLEHINEQRRMGYIDYISVSRDFAQDIRIFNLGKMLKEKYKKLWEDFFTNKLKLIKKRTIISGVFSVLPEIFLIGISLYICTQIFENKLTVGDYSYYTAILSQLNIGVIVLINVIMQIYDNKLRIDNVRTFKKFSNKIKNDGTQEIDKIRSIELKNVSFKYPGTKEYVLKKINFNIYEGEKICLVGINGAGKTTIIKLLLRFYDVEEGEIRINSRNIKEYDIVSLRKNISSLFQQYINFSFTIRENIIISDLEKYNGDDSEVLDAVNNAGAKAILDKSDISLDTFLSKGFEQKGIELSGGEYHKLAIARTFFRRSNFIILDEPSASLDPEAENELFNRFIKLCKNKTALFTSHRLSNVCLADRIIVIEDGEILEEGTHAELMYNQKRYSTLFGYQADKYKK